MFRLRTLFLLALAAVTAATAACSADDSTPAPAKGSATQTTAAGSPGASTVTTPETPAKRLGTSAGISTTAKAPDFTALSGAKAEFGALGKAVYQIEMPEKWNGEVVYYAHGFRGFGTEVAVEPPPAGLRKLLIVEGFAWAASSYSENGYTPGIGADDTLALKRHFEARYGKAKRSYLVGASMGGNVVTLSLEHFPDEYDGALAVCGAVAGESQIDYLTSWTALAEFTSGVRIPVGEGSRELAAVLLQQLPKALGTPDAPTAQGSQFISTLRMLTGGPRPFFLEGFKEQYVANFGLVLLDPDRKSVAGAASTNEGVTYAVQPGLGLSDERLNAGVRRFKANPAMRDAAAHPDAVPTSGKISRPLLTLHGTGDLFVPISQEQIYRASVEAAGRGDLLVQRVIRSAGHCKFSVEEMNAGFSDLVSWVKDGKKPAGDNLLGDLTDAGKQFTNPIRPGDPGTK